MKKALKNLVSIFKTIGGIVFLATYITLNLLMLPIILIVSIFKKNLLKDYLESTWFLIRTMFDKSEES